jgi:hypothetical protein
LYNRIHPLLSHHQWDVKDFCIDFAPLLTPAFFLDKIIEGTDDFVKFEGLNRGIIVLGKRTGSVKKPCRTWNKRIRREFLKGVGGDSEVSGGSRLTIHYWWKTL